MTEFSHNKEQEARAGVRLATPSQNVYWSFFASQGYPRLQEDLLCVYGATHPEDFKAMYDRYFSTDESRLAAIDDELRRPYMNDLSHPGRVAENEYRRKGTDTLVGALGHAALMLELGVCAGLESWLRGIAIKMADSDAHFLRRPERRNKPEADNYTLLRANSASHLLHYMFLDNHANYPSNSIMHVALDAAAVLRQGIEDGTMAPDPRVWRARSRAFRTHLLAYPQHTSYMSTNFLTFINRTHIEPNETLS